MQVLHHEVDSVAMFPAHKAAVGVLPYIEREAWGVVVMKRTETLVVLHRESESLCDPLYGEVAESLEFESCHVNQAFLPLRYSSVLV